MKKLRIAALLLALLLLLLGCGSQPKPDTTVDSFFKAAKLMDFETIATLIDPSATQELPQMDELFESGETDTDAFPAAEYFIDYLKTNASKLTYTIKSSEIKEDRATVMVDVTYVDSLPVFKETIGELFMQALSMAFSGTEMTEEVTNQLFETILKENIASSEEVFVTKTIAVPLILKEKIWYVEALNDDLLNSISSGLKAAESMFDESGLIGTDEE